MDRTEEIRARCEAATPGQWSGLRAAYQDCLLVKKINDGEYLMTQNDINFIAHAREDIPWLLSRNDELTQEAGRLREEKKTEFDIATGYYNKWQKAEAKLAELREAQRWIPATEPLDTGEYVFVVCENRTLHAAVWTGKQWKGRCNTRQRELAFQRAELMKEEVERFFRGKWAQDLCGNVDPMMILRRLQGDERAAKGDKVSGSAH